MTGPMTRRKDSSDDLRQAIVMWPSMSGKEPLNLHHSKVNLLFLSEKHSTQFQCDAHTQRKDKTQEVHPKLHNAEVPW